MTKFRLSATGKLYHLIKLSIERIGIVPTAKKEKIKENYELEEPSPETLKKMGHKESESDSAKQARIKVRFKIVLKDNWVSLLGLALTEWDDPGNPEIKQEWKEIRIKLASTTDPQARIPQRYCGETKIELNSSYIQRGMDTSKGLVWFNHLSQLPSWAKEKECEHLKEARWIEKEIFDSITSNVIQMGKEIKLEDKHRNDGKQRSRDIFPKDTVVWFCTFEKGRKKNGNLQRKNLQTTQKVEPQG